MAKTDRLDRSKRLKAGFPTHKSFAEHCGVTRLTVLSWENDAATELAIKYLDLFLDYQKIERDFAEHLKEWKPS